MCHAEDASYPFIRLVQAAPFSFSVFDASSLLYKLEPSKLCEGPQQGEYLMLSRQAVHGTQDFVVSSTSIQARDSPTQSGVIVRYVEM